MSFFVFCQQNLVQIIITSMSPSKEIQYFLSQTPFSTYFTELCSNYLLWSYYDVVNLKSDSNFWEYCLQYTTSSPQSVVAIDDSLIQLVAA